MKLVIFDCDGVLVDTEPTTQKTLSENLGGYGFAIAPQDCHKLFVGGTMASADAFLRTKGVPLPDNWVEEINNQLFARLSQGVTVYDGILPLLDQLEAASVATAIASNGPPEKMRVTLGPSGLWQRFQGRIFSAHTHPPAKPAPDMLLAAACAANIAPADCVMIDDNPSGLKAAHAAGMTAIGFASDGDPERLSPYTAQIVDKATELPKVLRL